jgi:hypothetical protein
LTTGKSVPSERDNEAEIMTTPTSGVRGMGEIGAGLSGTRTDPDFIGVSISGI